MEKQYKMWDKNGKSNRNQLFEKFNSSLELDKILYPYELRIRECWTQVLLEAGIYSVSEKKKVLSATRQIKREMDSGTFVFLQSDEDIHTAVERRLIEITGEPGEKIHTGLSRNDLIVTEVKMYLKSEIDEMISNICNLQKTSLSLAKREKTTVIPGYTHLQQAQLILFSHYMMSLFSSLERDKTRLENCKQNTDSMPLGSGSLGGTTLPVDRNKLANILGFSKASKNSIDSVSHRDFIIEFTGVCSILINTLSRYAEDFIIWCSHEFGYVEIGEQFTTGSSLMPQKRNPDSLELIRAKAGRIIGNLVFLLSVVKGVPLTYSKDLQEDKFPLFDTCSTTSDCLKLFSHILKGIRVNKNRIKSQISETLYATDLSEYLVRKGIPFRTSHNLIGKLFRNAVKHKIPLSRVSLDEYKKISPLFGEDVYDCFQAENSINSKNSYGGTSVKSVERQFKIAEDILNKK